MSFPELGFVFNRQGPNCNQKQTTRNFDFLSRTRPKLQLIANDTSLIFHEWAFLLNWARAKLQSTKKDTSL